ncbi:hypothetical protein FCIRC_4286 [Fusarium circinatum]|uniref:Chromo domain-containing protein n=1 Tax=Fusarium circinatum TaxID=48490 RepID=A0A8H5X1L6_FUSCI|nr:hypothetical protein FCIRC_4286 [Fusarium circinatum]
MASPASTPDSWAIVPSPMDDMHPSLLILKHKVDTIGDKDGPFVALYIRGSKSRARWEGWVDERFFHERDEAKLLAYWKKVGGRDAQGMEACPLRILYAHGRRKDGQGTETEYFVQYIGYPNDPSINQWEPESKVLEAQWD